MKRDKNGRFLGAKKIEITIPSIASFLKYLVLIFIFLPWAYLSISKLDLISLTKKLLASLFGPINCECECDCSDPIQGQNQKNPY